MAKQQEYKIHPAADCWPMLPEAEQQAQADSIAKIGLLVPVVLLDGMILDGRCRMKGCELAGIEPHFVEYDGDQTPEGIADYLDAVNDRRRHMTAIQIAATVVKLVNWQEKLADGRKRMGEGGKKKGAQGIQKVEYHAPADPNERTENSKLAERKGVNRQYIADCKRWQEERPEVIDQLRDGTLTYGQAKALEKEAQQDADRRQQNKQLARPDADAIKGLKNSPGILVSANWWRPKDEDWIDQLLDWKLAGRLDSAGGIIVFRTLGDTQALLEALSLLESWGTDPLPYQIAVAGIKGAEWQAELLAVGVKGKPNLSRLPTKKHNLVHCPESGIESLVLSWFKPWAKERGTPNLISEILSTEPHEGFQFHPWKPEQTAA